MTNGFGSATSNNATLTVTANAAPTGTITLPVVSATYAGGDTISYAGTGTDPEDGTLPASAFTWQVDFRHDTHSHPFVPATSGSKSGSFVIPTSGETSANVWYRIILTVHDVNGLMHTTYRDVQPRKATITLATVRSGLQVTLDGQPQTAPYSVQGVVGIVRAIGVTSPQTVTSTPWTFVSWSDAGAATHNITTPASNTTYTATFRAQIGVPANESVVPITTPGASSERVAPIATAVSGEPPRARVDAGEMLGPPEPERIASATSMRAGELRRSARPVLLLALWWVQVRR